MKHKLPNIQKLIQKDFILIKNLDENLFSQDHKSNGSNTPVFHFNGATVFFTFLNRLENAHELNALPWKETISITKNAEISRVVPLLVENDILLVTDLSNKAIGYLSANHVLFNIYRSYEYLNAYFNTIIETMDASISMIDENERVIVWTKGAEQIFSINANEIIGQRMSRFFPRERLQVLDTLVTGKAVYREQHQPQEDVFVLINTNPVRVNDQIIGAVAAEVDITSQVRLNQELFQATTKLHDLEREVAKFNSTHDPFFQFYT